MPLPQLIFASLCFLVCVSALVWGGAPERIVGCGFLTAYVATAALPAAGHGYYSSVETNVALVDVCLLILIMYVGCLSTRYWAVPMASMQLLDVFGHVSKMLDTDILPQAYFAVVVFISIPMVMLLAVGILNHRSRLRRFGHDPSWVSGLPASYRAGWPVDRAPDEDS